MEVYQMEAGEIRTDNYEITMGASSSHAIATHNAEADKKKKNKKKAKVNHQFSQETCTSMAMPKPTPTPTPTSIPTPAPSSSSTAGMSNCYVFKSRLQEYAQKAGLTTPVYETVKEGPSHEPSFRSTVILNNVRYDSLLGFFNRKTAEQSAAEVALTEISNSVDTKFGITLPVHETGLCKNLLQEYAQKMNYAVPLYECHKVDTKKIRSLYSCTVDIGGTKYIGASASTKKEAELKAARTALLAIQLAATVSDNPNGNSTYTVLPQKKKSPDLGISTQEIAAALKPRKGRFKKPKNRKFKHDLKRFQRRGLMVNMAEQAGVELVMEKSGVGNMEMETDNSNTGFHNMILENPTDDGLGKDRQDKKIFSQAVVESGVTYALSSQHNMDDPLVVNMAEQAGIEWVMANSGVGNIKMEIDNSNTGFHNAILENPTDDVLGKDGLDEKIFGQAVVESGVTDALSSQHNMDDPLVVNMAEQAGVGLVMVNSGVGNMETETDNSNTGFHNAILENPTDDGLGKDWLDEKTFGEAVVESGVTEVISSQYNTDNPLVVNMNGHTVVKSGLTDGSEKSILNYVVSCQGMFSEAGHVETTMGRSNARFFDGVMENVLVPSNDELLKDGVDVKMYGVTDAISSDMNAGLEKSDVTNVLSSVGTASELGIVETGVISNMCVYNGNLEESLIPPDGVCKDQES